MSHQVVNARKHYSGVLSCWDDRNPYSMKRVMLRETPLFFVDAHKRRYRKSSGFQDVDDPLSLKLETIEPAVFEVFALETGWKTYEACFVATTEKMIRSLNDGGDWSELYVTILDRCGHQHKESQRLEACVKRFDKRFKVADLPEEAK